MNTPSSRPSPTEQDKLLGHYRQVFLHDLVVKTHNFSKITWLGHPIWQNVLDLWTIQETIAEIKPALLIECGTNRGGSALFFAHLFELIGRGSVVTIDIRKMHSLAHPRIDFLIGSSTNTEIVAQVKDRTREAGGPVMVILDSDHSSHHVLKEMESYGPLVTPGSFMLVQDGVIDTLSAFAHGRPGPLVAIKDFLGRHPEFSIDEERCERFLITHHPTGWLRREPG